MASESKQALAGVRESRRLPVVTRVRRLDGERAEWQSVNISEGGMFLSGTPVLPTGTLFSLAFNLPGATNDDRERSLRARVVWLNNPGDPKSDPRLPAGMGVAFVDNPSDSQRWLRTGLYGASNLDVAAAGPEDEMLACGAMIGAYRIVNFLGGGGMGSVYVAEHVELGRRVALKRLHQRLTQDRDAVRRFFEEGRIVNRVHHEHVVEITDFLSEGAEKFYVMEFLEGPTLQAVVDGSGSLPVERAVKIGLQLAAALQAVHEAGVLHRDLKPANVVLIRRHGTNDFVKLLDFGIAKMKLPDGVLLQTIPGLVVGTPSYMAPEHCLGHEPDARADIYALGVILYQLLSGALPFAAKSFAELVVEHLQSTPSSLRARVGEQIPLALDALVLQCLAKDPLARPTSAAAVVAALNQILEGTEPAVLSTDAIELIAPPTLGHRRRALWFSLAGMLALVVALALGLAFWPHAAPSSQTLDPVPHPLVQPAPKPQSASPGVQVPPAPAATQPGVKETPERSPRPAKAGATKRRIAQRRGTLDPFAE